MNQLQTKKWFDICEETYLSSCMDSMMKHPVIFLHLGGDSLTNTKPESIKHVTQKQVDEIVKQTKAQTYLVMNPVSMQNINQETDIINCILVTGETAKDQFIHISKVYQTFTNNDKLYGLKLLAVGDFRQC